MDDKEESCCTIDYEHHKEIFERRRQAFLKDPEKAVTTHQAKIRLIKDHYKEAQVPGGYTIACDEPVDRGGSGKRPGAVAVSGRLRRALTAESIDAVCVISRGSDRQSGADGCWGIRSERKIRPC
jgi:hypothetical protein